MRILSARIHRARRDRDAGTVAAIVALTILGEGPPVRAYVPVCVAAHSDGAAPMRDRILGAAKLAFASRTGQVRTARAA